MTTASVPPEAVVIVRKDGPTSQTLIEISTGKQEQSSQHGTIKDETSVSPLLPSVSRYPLLLPKPLPSTPEVEPAIPYKKQPPICRVRQRCRVKPCQIPNCTLNSHRYYNGERSQSIPLKSSRRDLSSKIRRSEQIVKASTRTTNESGKILDLVRGGVDGLPALPLDGLDVTIFRELFHDFFSYHFRKMKRMIFPPPLTAAGKQQWEGHDSLILERAFSAPIYCLQYIATSLHSNVFRSDLPVSNRYINLLQGRLLKLLRAKLNDYVPAEIAGIIQVIHTLVMLDVSAGRISTLDLHRKAIENLIKILGGVHNMPTSPRLMLTLDRTISIFTSEPPLYSPPREQFPRKARSAPAMYGAHFKTKASLHALGHDIHQYCLDACHLIEILEHEGWTFEPNDPPWRDTSNVNYFFFLRECLANDFVRLNISTRGNKDMARCTLLATKIVDFIVLQDFLVPEVGYVLARRIQNIISDPANVVVTEHDRPSAIWVLFTLVSISRAWSGRAWALAQLRLILNQKYGASIWPIDWRQQELLNVRQFVWSDSRLNVGFGHACTELDAPNPGKVLEAD